MSSTRPLRCASLLQHASRALHEPHRCLHTAQRYTTARHVPQLKTVPFAAQCRHASRRARRALRPYSEEEKQKLKTKYTPEQLEAIEAGEAAIDVDDMFEQGALRHGQMAPDYVDDFSKIQPTIDKQPQPSEPYYDPKLRFKNEDELAADLSEWVESLPEDADRVEFDKFLDNTRLMVGDENAERNGTNYLQPEIPKIDDSETRRLMREAKADDGRENTPQLLRLSKQINMPVHKIRQLRTKNLVYHRVTNQTRMGKISSQYYLTVAGDGKGMLGIGEGKAQDNEEARRQAQLNAIRNMVPIPRYENRTIYGDVKGKVGATELELFSRPPGFGIRTQAKIFEMCRCAGISDLAARVTRARNPMNTIKATLQALLSQKDPEQIARARGMKMVDVRKVYYAGNV